MEHRMWSPAERKRHGRTVGAVLVGVGALVAGVGVWTGGPLALTVTFVPGVVALAIGLVLTALGGATLWWALLALVGAKHPWSSVALAWCGGTPAKYLPGKVGSVVARAALLGEPHGPHAATATAEVLLTLAVGGLIAVAIPLERSGRSTAAAAVVVGATSIALVWFARRRLAPATQAPVGVGPWLVAVAALAFGWLGQGMALGGAVAAVGGPVSPLDVTLWCGIAGAAAIAGVVSPMPAGLGPRDALLGLLVVEFVDDDIARATAAVLGWRLASVAVELLLAGGAALASRWRAGPDEAQP